jgi:hypothetical protein
LDLLDVDLFEHAEKIKLASINATKENRKFLIDANIFFLPPRRRGNPFKTPNFFWGIYI